MALPSAIVQPPVEAKFPAPPYFGSAISPFSRISFVLARPSAQNRWSRYPAFSPVIRTFPSCTPRRSASYSGSKPSSRRKRALSWLESIAPARTNRAPRSPHETGSTTPCEGITCSSSVKGSVARLSASCAYISASVSMIAIPRATKSTCARFCVRGGSCPAMCSVGSFSIRLFFVTTIDHLVDNVLECPRFPALHIRRMRREPRSIDELKPQREEERVQLVGALEHLVRLVLLAAGVEFRTDLNESHGRGKQMLCDAPGLAFISIHHVRKQFLSHVPYFAQEVEVLRFLRLYARKEEVLFKADKIHDRDTQVFFGRKVDVPGSFHPFDLFKQRLKSFL